MQSRRAQQGWGHTDSHAHGLWAAKTCEFIEGVSRVSQPCKGIGASYPPCIHVFLGTHPKGASHKHQCRQRHGMSAQHGSAKLTQHIGVHHADLSNRSLTCSSSAAPAAPSASASCLLLPRRLRTPAPPPAPLLPAAAARAAPLARAAALLSAAAAAVDGLASAVSDSDSGSELLAAEVSSSVLVCT
jgi:hypothetical protein